MIKIELTEREASELIKVLEKIKKAKDGFVDDSNSKVLADVLKALDRSGDKNNTTKDVKSIDDYFESLPRNTIEDDSHYTLSLKKYEDDCRCPKCFNSMIACGDHFECTYCNIIWNI